MKNRVFSFVLAFVLVISSVSVVWAFDESKAVEVEGDYYYIEPFSKGLARVIASGDRFGYIDKTGKLIEPLVTSHKGDVDYTEVVDKTGKTNYCFGIGIFSEGLAPAYIDYGVGGFINETYEVVIPFIYNDVNAFSEGLAAVSKDGSKGFIDRTGKEVVPFIYDEFGFFMFQEGLSAVTKDGKYGFIDKTGKEVIPFIYESADSFTDGIATVKKDGKYGIIDKTGKVVVPFIYEYSISFSEGLAAVRKDGKYGFIDKTGKEVVPFIYESAGKFSEGLAAVTKDGKRGFIDKTGKVVVPFIYTDLTDSIAFSEGLVAVTKGDGKYGFIDKTGKEVVPFIYERPTSFSEGIAVVRKDNGKWILININDLGLSVEASTSKAETTATPSATKLMVNGKAVSVDAYTINDSNYIKLRDLAALVNNTNKNFEVTFNNDTKVINLISNKAYTPTGGELTKGNGQSQTATLTTSKIYIDGKE